MSGLKHVGIAAAISVLVAGGVVVAGNAVGSDEHLVKARFVSAAPLVTGNQVKVDGVVVGTVKKLAVKGGLAEVSLDLDAKALPLHNDARLTIRPVSLLGERYIDLDRGDPGAPVLDTRTPIPVSHTASAVGLDEVLNSVDDPAGEGLRGLVTTLGEGMQGNGANVDKALKALSPSLRDTRKLAAVLAQHNALLSRLVDDFEPVAGALATRDGKAMDQLVASSAAVLDAVRTRQHDLDQTLEKLPGTLRVLRSTLANLRATASEAAPTLAELRPLTDKLPQLAGELRGLSNAMDPALASSEPVLERARTLLRQAAPVAAAARTAGPSLARTTSGLRRVSAQLTRNRSNLFDYIRYWALTTNGYDGLSHYFRVNASVNPATLTGLLPASKPTATTTRPGTGSVPGLLGGLVPQLSGVTGLLDGLLGGTGLLRPPASGRDTAGPTGLTEKQETNLLGLLLGGR